MCISDRDGDDSYVYGSLTEETRQALEYLHGWYENGILDQDYMMRTPGEIGELIRDNRCGAFFGWWWAPNNPLIEAVEANPGAEWKPYVIADEYGEVHSYICLLYTSGILFRDMSIDQYWKIKTGMLKNFPDRKIA